MGNWQCGGCSALHNETENNDVESVDKPVTWVCPNCGAPRSVFREVRKETSKSPRMLPRPRVGTGQREVQDAAAMDSMLSSLFGCSDFAEERIEDTLNGRPSEADKDNQAHVNQVRRISASKNKPEQEQTRAKSISMCGPNIILAVPTKQHTDTKGIVVSNHLKRKQMDASSQKETFLMGKQSDDCGHRLYKAWDKQRVTTQPRFAAPPSVIPTSCNIQGSRSSNEDHAGSSILTSYAFSYVCDGHAGASIATIVGNTFRSALEEQLQLASPEVPPQALLDFLRTAYNTALDDVETHGNKVGFEHHNTGTTITAVLVQRGTNICASLQLGDCRAGVCDATTGELLKGKLLLSEGSDRVTDPASCETVVTHEHCFGDSYETQRIKDAIKPHGTWSLATQLRPDAQASECRYTGHLVQDGTSLRFRFNEPVRAVENKLMYPLELRDGLATAQRTPELQAHQLPTDADQKMLLFCVCDGFFSHDAFPSIEALASCLVDPEAYMAQECLKATCMVNMLDNKHSQHLLSQAQQWMPRTNNLEWQSDPTKCCYQLMKCLAPDEAWQTAVDMSWDSISQLRTDHGGRVPTLLETPKAAVEMATNLAVLLMSDDNISIEALVLQPVES